MQQDRRGHDQIDHLLGDTEPRIDAGQREDVEQESAGEEGRSIPVRLFTKITEVGTLELWCESRDAKRRWKLEFNVRESPANG